ncbi:MAG: acetyl-CoA carboxylase biotin carboxyl carrier protein [Flavobacteriaceae bacterium]|nr:acetyl-CoA carboxylase biotin carboxyl carrier protein [Flavobacteriaceae bacterium]
MELKDIQNLIKFVAKSGASEVKLEMEDVKITIRTGKEGTKGETTYIQQVPTIAAAAPAAPATPAPVEAAAPAATEAAPPAATEDSNYITIKSPIIGTFYRKPSPDKPAFKEVGDSVAVGDVLCVIEAMKLFNEIESEVSGKIVKVLVDDSSPVEFDQPLFLVDPS